MEVAALTTAHSHARRASDAFQQLHVAVAADEHQSAASDLARARKGTSDSEALRVLRLLEEQHRRLARIIKTQNAAATVATTTEEPAKQDAADLNSGSKALSPPVETPQVVSTASKADSTTPALAQSKLSHRSRDRETSPALAKDIATRRGIPIPGQQRHLANPQLSPDSHRRRPQSDAAPKIPPSVVDSQASLARAAANSKREDHDEGFSKFYSDITTGAMSKLSSVLAFSGLPLTQQEQPEPLAATKPKETGRQRERTVKANNDPDVKKIFSPAALSAIEASQHFGPAESFYVVQPAGGLLSYADITKANQIRQNLSEIGEEGDDDAFIDAREVPSTTSPADSRRFGKARTGEELELENSTLKQTLEHVANRLAEFEKHAQDASMAALAQSMISTRGADARGGGSGGHDALLMEKMRRMEEQMAHEREERQRLESKLVKYRGKWEQLKAGAKEKEKQRFKGERPSRPTGGVGGGDDDTG